jgi:hypothetical protein
MATLLRVWLSLWLGETHWLDSLETDVMWDSASRMLQQDVHAAVQASAVNGQLRLTVADGTSYSYVRNGTGQLVRVRSGGGTAVAAVGVQDFEASVSGGLVTVHALFGNGDQHQLQAAMLTGEK